MLSVSSAFSIPQSVFTRDTCFSPSGLLGGWSYVSPSGFILDHAARICYVIYVSIDRPIAEFKVAAKRLYGRRLKTVVLYGSWARGQGTSDSDIDLAVVLAGRVSPGREIDRMIDFVTDVNLKHRVLISIYPVSDHEYRTVRSPLLVNLRREGIVL